VQPLALQGVEGFHHGQGRGGMGQTRVGGAGTIGRLRLLWGGC
jgi:hypothetical protein